MEKTNELNKFLSYIHMGNTIFRIYYEETTKFENSKLTNKLQDIMEMFKKHEEKITSMIESYGEKATDSLTMAGIIGVYKEKLKVFDDEFDICINAIKTTNMGYLSSIKFLKENNNLADDIKDNIIVVIKDYEEVIKILRSYICETILE